MAGESRNVERRDVKMGRSKFPGRPGKTLNRRRVNLSSCSLPEHNECSDAADKICFGLSVFNKPSGDSALDFLGFNLKDLEGSLTARRQIDIERRFENQGVDGDLWSNFQPDVSSQVIPSNTTQPPKKTSTCFDGGGKAKTSKEKIKQTVKPESSNIDVVKTKKLTVCVKKIDSILKEQAKTVSRPKLLKNLQREAAKRLLQKAKQVNKNEGMKPTLEKKFVLPSRSAHSSRVIKPTKRFLENNVAKTSNKSKDRNPDTSPLVSDQASNSETTPSASNQNKVSEPSSQKKPSESSPKSKPSESSPQSKATEPSPQRPSGKVILREARLQLDSSPSSLGEGPFSSPSASSLIPSQQRQGLSTVVCGVCGAVRFYKSSKQARKFGTLSCESCRKYISRTIRRRSDLLETGIKCLKGTGLCMVPAVVQTPAWNSKPNGVSFGLRCKACWLKLCLRRFQIPSPQKEQLLELLPAEMRTDFALPKLTDTNPFNVPGNHATLFKSFTSMAEKVSFPPSKSEAKTEEKSKKVKSSKKEKSAKRQKDSKSKMRQRVPVAGPRVKHVCRSASVVLGQPVATFPEKPTDEDCCETEEVVDPPLPLVPVETKPPKAPLPADPPKTVKAPPQPELPPGLIQHGRKKKNNEPSEENLVSMDFWEIYDPDEVCETGFSLIGSQPFSVRALCFLCGSAGQEKLVHCACCCEPYHEFCVSDTQVKGNVWRYDWVCPRCTLCVICGRASGQQLKCVRCENSYHSECVGGRLLHSPDRPWVCSSCLRCKSCNAVDVSVFVGNLPLCKSCFVLRQKGNFCPLCQRCYEDDDYDCKMMECGGCKSWVHAKCEGISDEKYQVLSFLPESVEFICRMCCAMPPALWWIAVEAELKAGYLGVLKALSKNRTACRMLRWSPRKVCSCRRRESSKLASEEDSLDGERRDSPPPASDSGIGSTDDELKLQQDEQEDCFCFLEVDSYNSRSKPFSPNLLSIKKKVTTSEYSSLTQFHEDMRNIVEMTQSEDLMEVYYSAIKEVFPWFDPKAAKVLGASRGGSLENTPVKSSPMKQCVTMPSIVPVASFDGKGSDYFYSDCGIEDTRICLLCKVAGDGLSEESGRLLYCGQNEWVHCNCALWSGEVFEEIDGSLQNVQSALSRGRGIRCPHCQLKGASIGCCVRSCSETYHFPCARAVGCVFLDDKSVYCRAHASESAGRLLQNEKDFEMRRPVYVELDKKRTKPVDTLSVKLAVGGLHVDAIGRFVPELSDLPEAIVPADFRATRLFWSSREPWRLVRYTLSVRCIEPEQSEGVDLGVNLTIDHGRFDIESRMRQLRHFQLHHTLLPLDPPRPSKRLKRRIFDPLEEPDNQDLLPPDLEEAILKELSHDMLEGISVQDLFQDIGDRDRDEEGGEEEPLGPQRARKTGTLRTGNWNAKAEKNETKWKRKQQEGKENKMVSWCARLLQVDGAVDSSSGSEAGESPGRSADMPADIPQLDGTEDSDYESCDGLPETEEAPVTCGTCRCTYRTQRSFERHLESRCHDMLLSSSDEEEVATASPPPPPPAAKPPKPRTYSRKKPVTMTTPPQVTSAPQSAPSIIIPQSPVPVILQEMPSYQPMVQYIVEPQKPLIVPNTYQVVLPPSPMMLSTPSPMFEVVTDPHTGGMFLSQPQPQPVLYNMETIVSNTVMQTNQFMTSSYSQTSTQVFQASKLEQVVNLPTTSYVLAPSDLICVPVQQQLPAQPVRSQWTPPKPKQIVVKAETPPAPPPPKSKPRSRALVDYINNFRSDAPDVPSTVSEPNPKVQSFTPRRPLIYSPARQAAPVSKPTRPAATPLIPSPPRKRAVAPVVRSPIVAPVVRSPIVAPVVRSPIVSPVVRTPIVSPVVRTPMVAPVVRTPIAAPPQQAAAPRRPIYNVSPQHTLSISMPSLDDSPPTSCDNSPVLLSSRPLNNSALNTSPALRTPPSRSSYLPLSALTSVNSNGPSPLRMPVMSPQVTPESFTLQPVSTVNTLAISTSPNCNPLRSLQNSSSLNVSNPPPSTQSFTPSPVSSLSCNASHMSPPNAVSPGYFVNNPPSPFLSPRYPIHHSPSTLCMPSFTPPLPPSPSLSPRAPSHTSFNSQFVPNIEKPLSASISNQNVPLPTKSLSSDAVGPLEILKKKDEFIIAKPTTIPSSLSNSVPTLVPLRPSQGTPLKPVIQPQATVPQKGLSNTQDSNRSAIIQACDQNNSILKELKITPRIVEPEGPKLIYDVVADDGFKFSSTSLSDVWQKICESVQEIRAAYRMPTLPMTQRSHEILGMNNHGLQHLLEQLPGVGYCKKYQAKYFKQHRSSEEDLTPVKENLTGCARSEGYLDRKETDKFGWLASRHRKLPRVKETTDDSNRRTTNLPMAMRYRQLRESSKQMFVYRSKIHGMGLFCLREIEAGEMVIEYSGELIRSVMTDKREKLYTERGIGCYMFRIDDHAVVDATMNGNAARFINHSCEPNCYSKVVDILGKKHIIIFALRRISVMEELTYDYKFPFEDVKISCHCQSKKCRKYLN